MPINIKTNQLSKEYNERIAWMMGVRQFGISRSDELTQLIIELRDEFNAIPKKERSGQNAKSILKQIDLLQEEAKLLGSKELIGKDKKKNKDDEPDFELWNLMDLAKWPKSDTTRYGLFVPDPSNETKEDAGTPAKGISYEDWRALPPKQREATERRAKSYSPFRFLGSASYQVPPTGTASSAGSGWTAGTTPPFTSGGGGSGGGGGTGTSTAGTGGTGGGTSGTASSAGTTPPTRDWLKDLRRIKAEKNELDRLRMIRAYESRYGALSAMTRRALVRGFEWGGEILGFRTGGRIPGYGGGDRVPAFLERGEFVVRKEVAKGLMPELQELNRSGLDRKNSLLFGKEGFREIIGGGHETDYTSIFGEKGKKTLAMGKGNEKSRNRRTMEGYRIAEGNLVSVLGHGRGTWTTFPGLRGVATEKLLGSSQDYTRVLSDASISRSNILSDQNNRLVYKWLGGDIQKRLEKAYRIQNYNWCFGKLLEGI